jgi:hypothetical protein
MYSITLSSIALLTSLTSAVPSILPRGTGTAFHLIYAGNSNAVPPPVGALNHDSWAVSVSTTTGHAILVPNVNAAASTFYQYYGGVGIASTGIIITPGGTATVPSGNYVELVNNNGTQGVAIKENKEGLPTLQYKKGGFMACRDGDEIVLRYVSGGQRLWADCAKADLIAVCAAPGPEQELGVPQVVECQSN